MIKIIARVMGGNFDSKINGQIENSANFSTTKKDLAKILTTLNNKKAK